MVKGRHKGERFDVVIVGARCAGSPLAAVLARRGLRVVVVDEATFPRDTLSSHVIQADSLAFLDGLGLTERLRATGAPFTSRVDARFEDLRVVADVPLRPGDVGGGACIRRFVLDPILADAAREAGAEVRMATKVVGLVRERGRVAGVRVTHAGRECELLAPLVVGADGRNSTVAKLCGARKYNVVQNERVYHWTFFENADLSGDAFVFHRWGDRFVLASPADDRLFMVAVSPEAGARGDFRHDLEGTLVAHARACEPVAQAIEGARRATKIFGIVRFTGYFREAAGPGWVLLGDSGHFKDPAAGRGIGDAFLQIRRLEPVIASGPGESGIDERLAAWWRWRDREFAEHYWVGADFGAAGTLPAAAPEMIRRLHARGRTDRLVELLSHRRRPSQVLTVPAFAAATVRLLRDGDRDRRALLGETRTLVAREARRRRMVRRPVYAPPEVTLADAAPTDTDHPEARAGSHVPAAR